MKKYDRKDIKNIVNDIICETIEKNPFEIGDLVKLRPDILNLYHNGPNFHARSFHERLKLLRDKMGKINKIFPNGNTVNVEYSESWANKDEHGKKYPSINTIGVRYTDLVPYAQDPDIQEGVGYVSNKDMKKDPKHISGERWRIKFQSSNDIKKHGNTEKSKVSENEIRNVIQELLKEMWNEFEQNKKISEVEIPSRNYIITAKSGPVTTYYCNSPTQGQRMVQNAQSMASKFKTEEEVRKKILELKIKYPGITNWSFESIKAKSDWEDVWKSHGKEIKLGHQILKPVKKDDEWIVKWMTDGKRNEGKTYYTDDKKDAFDTYVYMLRQAQELNKQLGQK